MFRKIRVRALALGWLAALTCGLLGASDFAQERNAGLPPLALNLSGATIVMVGEVSSVGVRATELFQRTVAEKCGETWTRTAQTTLAQWPAGTAVVVGERSQWNTFLKSVWPATVALRDELRVEGFVVMTYRHAFGEGVLVLGDDGAGVLYGLGHLLRQMSFGAERVGLTSAVHPIAVQSAPKYPVRGFTFSYGELSNTYGGWTLAQARRYVEEFAWFGMNHLQLATMPRPSKVNPENHEVVMRELAAAAQELGMKVSLFAPLPDEDYSTEAGIKRLSGRWDRLMNSVARVDGMLVPGGDPGHTPAPWVLPAVASQAPRLAQRFPDAEVWVTFQGFSRTEAEAVIEHLAAEKPDWLTGVAIAPWTDLTARELREKLPAKYAVRSYIDLTHVLHSEYPVAGLDQAAALVHGREPIAPRPQEIADIVRRDAPWTIGGVMYSEGVHDDVNKALWLQLLWNPEREPTKILEDYARFFVSERWTSLAAAVLERQERSWLTPLGSGAAIRETAAQLKKWEKDADLMLLRNWRAQLMLYRGYLDSYLLKRVQYEAKVEAEALAVLSNAGAKRIETALKEARSVFDRSQTWAYALPERSRILQLGEALFQSIGMRLSVEPHRAMSQSRGATLDSMDWPLNNRGWWENVFEEASAMKSSAEKWARVQAALEWERVGSGELYWDAGKEVELKTKTFPTGVRLEVLDPEQTLRMQAWTRERDIRRMRLSWLDHLGSVRGHPLSIRISGLAEKTAYELTVVYGNLRLNGASRLVANGTHEVHGHRKLKDGEEVQTFVIPRSVIRNGVLELTWTHVPEKGSLEGITHVSELRLRKVR